MTVAEGLRTTLGPNTFPCVRDWVHEIIRVSEAEIIQAMQLVFERLKVVAEASSCVAYAAVRTPEFERIVRAKFPNEQHINIGVILTGGNVDFTQFFAKF
jgi:threonine dehydratase